MRGLLMTACGVVGAGVLVFGTPSATGYDISGAPIAGQPQQQQQPPPPPPPPQRPQDLVLEATGIGGGGPKLGHQTSCRSRSSTDSRRRITRAAPSRTRTAAGRVTPL